MPAPVNNTDPTTLGKGPLQGGLWPWVLQGKRTTEVLQITLAAFDAGVPVMLVSAPGQGKTATIEALFQTLNWDYHYISMASLSFDDVSGNPRAVDYTGPASSLYTEENKQTVYAMPNWQWKLLEQEETGKRTALIVDELNTASRATLKTFLPIFQSKALPSGRRFKQDTPLIGALNPTDQSDGYELSMAMRNRLLWLPWEPDSKEMGDGFEHRWVSATRMNLPVTLNPITDAKVILERERKIASIARAYRDDVMAGNFDREPDTRKARDTGLTSTKAFIDEQAWSSGRSWDNLVRILARIPVESITRSLLDTLVQGTVGRRWGNAFSVILYSELSTTGNGSNTAMIKYTDALEKFNSIDWETVSPTDMGLVRTGIISDMVSGDAEKVARSIRLLNSIHDVNAALDDSTVIRAMGDNLNAWKLVMTVDKTLRPAFTARFDTILDTSKRDY